MTTTPPWNSIVSVRRERPRAHAPRRTNAFGSGLGPRGRTQIEPLRQRWHALLREHPLDPELRLGLQLGARAQRIEHGRR